MNDNVSIRAAQVRDIASIAGLLTQLNAGEGYSIISEPDALAAALFADVREVNLHAFVAEHENEIIGTLLYYAGYDTLSASVGYHLADMVVHDRHRRAGVGKALMQALANVTQAENKAWVSLTAMKDNAAAQAFYSALGMTRVNVDFFAIGKSALTQM
mgnify:CR=1 FL=1